MANTLLCRLARRALALPARQLEALSEGEVGLHGTPERALGCAAGAPDAFGARGAVGAGAGLVAHVVAAGLLVDDHAAGAVR